jgi:hypothetical protein
MAGDCFISTSLLPATSGSFRPTQLHHWILEGTFVEQQIPEPIAQPRTCAKIKQQTSLSRLSARDQRVRDAGRNRVSNLQVYAASPDY